MSAVSRSLLFVLAAAAGIAGFASGAACGIIDCDCLPAASMPLGDFAIDDTNARMLLDPTVRVTNESVSIQYRRDDLEWAVRYTVGSKDGL